MTRSVCNDLHAPGPLLAGLLVLAPLLGGCEGEVPGESDSDISTTGTSTPLTTSDTSTSDTTATGTTDAMTTSSTTDDTTTTGGSTGADTTGGTTSGGTTGSETTGGELCDETAGSTGYVGGPDPAGLLQAYLKPDVVDPPQEFGRTVAIDGETLVACAYTYEVDGVERGAAFVFVRDEMEQWRLQDVLTPPEADRDLFCSSVAIEGDTVVVGAPQEDSDGSGSGNNDLNQAGAAFVYTRCGWDWELSAYLKPTVVGPSDEFGSAVAIDGDLIVVGAPFEDGAVAGIDGDATNNDTSNAGAAYVFARSGDAWSQTAYLKSSHPDPGDAFGEAVAISGSTIVVGASNEGGAGSGVNPPYILDGSFINSGAAFVFVLDAGNWSQQAYLKPSNTRANFSFGHDVDIDGDTLVVGAPGEASTSTGVNGDQDAIGNQSGAAYVLTRTGDVWTQQAYVKASNTGANDSFAASVAIDGDTLIVGAAQEDSASTTINAGQDDNTANGAGAAYTYTRNAGNWSVTDYIKAPNASAADVFGLAVDVSFDTLAIGAPFEDSDAIGVNGDPGNDDAGNNGAVYVFVP